MTIAAIVVALLLMFVAARYALASLEGRSVPARTVKRPADSGTLSLDAKERAKLVAMARAQLLLDAEIERRRNGEARRAADRAAAIARRAHEDIARRPRHWALPDSDLAMPGAARHARSW